MISTCTDESFSIMCKKYRSSILTPCVNFEKTANPSCLLPSVVVSFTQFFKEPLSSKIHGPSDSFLNQRPIFSCVHFVEKIDIGSVVLERSYFAVNLTLDFSF